MGYMRKGVMSLGAPSGPLAGVETGGPDTGAGDGRTSHRPDGANSSGPDEAPNPL